MKLYDLSNLSTNNSGPDGICVKPKIAQAINVPHGSTWIHMDPHGTSICVLNLLTEIHAILVTQRKSIGVGATGSL